MASYSFIRGTCTINLQNCISPMCERLGEAKQFGAGSCVGCTMTLLPRGKPWIPQESPDFHREVEWKTSTCSNLRAEHFSNSPVSSQETDVYEDSEAEWSPTDPAEDLSGSCQSDDGAGNPKSDDGDSSHSSWCSSETIPVKSTFIHFDMTPENNENEPLLKRSASAPAIPNISPFVAVKPSVKAAHDCGTCKPCAYFLAKTDGCRWGSNCEFCHLCPLGELKKRKKDKAKALKLEEQKTHPKMWYGSRPPWWNRRNAKKSA